MVFLAKLAVQSK